MQTLCIIGDGSLSAMESVADRLAETTDKRVATVDHTVESVAATDNGSADAFRVDGDGGWTGEGADRSARDLLDSLSTEYDYALVAGLAHHRLPTVAIGDAETPPSAGIVASAPTAAALDIASIVDRLDDVEPHITLKTLVERAKASPKSDRSGAIATFTGRVRAKDSPDDARTEHLAFEKYAGVAEERLNAIRQELTDRDGVFEVLLHHRVGRMNDGEDIVFVVVLAGHRKEAFRTVEDGIDRLKDEVPIFKKETTTDEEFWLHETE